MLIISPSDGIETNPSLMLLLELLAERRIEVDVIYPETPAFLAPRPIADIIRFRPQPERVFQLWPTRLLAAPQGAIRYVLGRDRRPGATFHPLFGLFKARQYSLLIGVDPEGIFMAHFLNRYAQRPLAYLSFELLFAEEISSEEERGLRRREHLACRHVSLALVQDEERAGLLCREASLPADRVMLVPVAPRDQEIPRTDHLRESLGIAADRRIVLYCGNVSEWASRDEWAEMLSYWPERYCLVVHSREDLDTRTRQYLRSTEHSGKLFVSSGPVPRHDMVRLVAAADFGLAPYKPIPGHWATGLNLHHLGLSSGKVSFYAMCGKPILARSLPVFEREFARYDCGRTYRRLAETGALLTEMDENYQHHAAEARRFYRERLDPTERMGQFCDRLIELAGRRTSVGHRALA